MYLSMHVFIPPGALLHYGDRDLNDVYFLDPQWLAKLMAKVIKPVEDESLVKNGMPEYKLILMTCFYTSHFIVHTYIHSY